MKNAFMSVILLSVVAAITCAPGSYNHNDERSVQQQKTYFEQLLELLEKKAKLQVGNTSILWLLYYSNIQHILANCTNLQLVGAWMVTITTTGATCIHFSLNDYYCTGYKLLSIYRVLYPKHSLGS